jgi:hypothetical protein
VHAAGFSGGEACGKGWPARCRASARPLRLAAFGASLAASGAKHVRSFSRPQLTAA